MALCSSLLVRWQRFLGRLSPAHAALFQLLLLLLLAANIAGVVLTARRLQHSYAFPISSLSVKRLDTPPPFTVAVMQAPYTSSGNMSLSCNEIFSPGEPPCPQSALHFDHEVVQLFAGASNGFDDMAEFVMLLAAEDAQAGECLTLQLLGVPLYEITTDSYISISNYAPPTSSFDFCPLFVPDSAFLQIVYLSFSALQDVHGRVNFSISVTATRHRMLPEDFEPLLELVVKTEGGGLIVPWETQQYEYTYIDFLSSVFAIFNISVTILAFLFPWRYVGAHVREERRFKLACDGRKDDDASADSEAEWELQRRDSRVQQLQERMLPLAEVGDPSGADALMTRAQVEQLVQRMFADRNQRAAAALHSGSQRQ